MQTQNQMKIFQTILNQQGLSVDYVRGQQSSVRRESVEYLE